MTAHTDQAVQGTGGALVPPHWRAPLLAVLLVWAWILFLFRETGAGMVSIWMRSETFTHGFFVPPLALWLMWRQRGRLWALTPRPVPWVLLLVAAASMLWLLADIVAANAPGQLALVALLVLAVPGLLGWQVTRVILFPLGFLFFAVPIGEFLMEPLMEGTATFAVLALRASGIPVYREGLQFVIPSGSWSVVEACSGVRYLIASLTVGTLYAHLSYRSAARRWLFIGVSVLVPIVANWLRAYLIVLLGHLTSNQLGAGVDHLIYGWVFFGIVIMLMFMIGARWADASAPPAASLAAMPAGLRKSPGPLFGMALAMAVFVLVPQWASARLTPDVNAPAPVLEAPAQLAPSWTRTPQPPTDWVPGFQNPSSQLQAGYAHGEQQVGLYIGYYRNQHAERKLVSSTNTLTPEPKSGWVRVASGARPLELDDPPLGVRVSELRDSPVPGRNGEVRLKVWQWYWVGGWWTSNDRMAKIYGAAQRLLGHGDESAVVMVYARDQDGADAALKTFVRANLPAIQHVLLRAKSQ
ncbi:exosortase A [Pseudorhodoferax sp.]|uniref:exosortase A n=1 Tax=Pseudorhodoferax sp. TaxID=1993553 RepID=UPI002DD66B4B|nr:exosortase A [Pseudorhodoferax sp.]